jgi:hypothetical protein
LMMVELRSALRATLYDQELPRIFLEEASFRMSPKRCVLTARQGPADLW